MTENQSRANSKPATVETSRGVKNLGYRGWSGDLNLDWTRWFVITVTGVRRSWKSSWLRRLLFFAWLPTLWFGTGFFIWEQVSLHPELREGLDPFVSGMPPTAEFDVIRQAIQTGDIEESRHTMWAWLLLTYFRYPQSVIMVLLIGLIAPPLISQDIRSRAFLLYFSRPLTRSEYLLGKLGTLWFYLSMISMLPALSLYVLGLLLSPNLGVIYATWDIPFRILAASIALMLPTSVFALCLSSLTQESRYAGFAWFAAVVLGLVTYFAAISAQGFDSRPPPTLRQGTMVVPESEWANLSLHHTLWRVERWIFGFGNSGDALVPVLTLMGLTVVSVAMLYRRISAPMRI